MRVLILGSGGREHVLVWLASRSPEVDKVYCLPGNAGTSREPKVQPIGSIPEDPLNPKHFPNLIDFVHRNKIDLTIVGPEQPLADGIVDRFCKAGLLIFGPTKISAQLETSKCYAKDIMLKANGVPTAQAAKFRASQHEDAIIKLAKHGAPVVIKADGLTAGKGSIVCQTLEKAEAAIRRCFVQKEFGPAGETLLIEDYLAGHLSLPRAEISMLALVDIHGHFIMFPAAQDYKPVYDGDQGPNTGGMGSFAPVPWLTPAMMEEIGQKIFQPVIQAMIDQDTPFSGVLYAGLIYTQDGFKVLEFNVRFGDPELQPLAMLMDFDLMPILKTIADGGSIANIRLKWKKGAAVCVVMASHGYPDSRAIKKGAEISIKRWLTEPELEPCKVFHAGTKVENGKLLTNGGRVLGVTFYSPDSLASASEFAYLATQRITWTDAEGNGPYYRTDIAQNVPQSI